MAEEKSITSMVITVVVALIVTGVVLVPIIQGLSGGDNGSEGGGDSNLGTYHYLTAKEGENHTLSISETDSSAIVEYDGETLVTMEKGTEAWILPIMATNDDIGGENAEFLWVLYYHIDKVSGQGSVWFEGQSITDSTTISPVLPQDYSISGKSVSELESECIWHIAEEGDLALVDKPIMGVDDTIYFAYFNQDGLETEGNPNVSTIKYVGIMGIGTLETLSENIYCPSSMYDWETIDNATSESGDYYDLESYPNNWQEGDITIDTSETSDGIRLNGISVITHWENTANPTWTQNITKFIVPVKEGGSSSDNGDLGTTGTILSVIPVFVILAILLYAVQYLRARPEQY